MKKRTTTSIETPTYE